MSYKGCHDYFIFGMLYVMEHRCDISVVIVAYKSSGNIGQCLESLSQQSSALKVQVIVVDNSREQECEQIVSGFVGKFAELKYIASDNIGFGRANNLGVGMAIGEYLLVLNPDTKLESGVLDSMKAFVATRKDVGIATCKLVRQDGRLDPACMRNLPNPWNSLLKLLGLSRHFSPTDNYNLSGVDENQQREIGACSGAFMFFRRDVLTKLEYLFDPEYFMYGEDLDLCFRVKQLGLKIWYYPETSCIHFKGMSSKQAFHSSRRAFYDSMWIYYKKNLSQDYPTVLNYMVYFGVKCFLFLNIVKNMFVKEALVSK